MPRPAALAVDTVGAHRPRRDALALAVGATTARSRYRAASSAPASGPRTRPGASCARRPASAHLRRAARRVRRPGPRPARLDPLDRLPRARPARHGAGRRRARAWIPRSRPAAARLRPPRDPHAARSTRLEGKLWWSNIAVGILPGPFTMSEARRGLRGDRRRRYDAATFARDLKATGLVVADGRPARGRAAGGPARAVSLRVQRRPGAPAIASASSVSPHERLTAAAVTATDGDDADGGQQQREQRDARPARSSPRRTAAAPARGRRRRDEREQRRRASAGASDREQRPAARRAARSARPPPAASRCAAGRPRRSVEIALAWISAPDITLAAAGRGRVQVALLARRGADDDDLVLEAAGSAPRRTSAKR